MHSATTVACSGNGIKRTASSALVSSADAAGSPASSSSGAAASTSKDEQADSPPPPEKRSFIVVESPIKLETVSSAEDLDIKVLRIQNKNLSDRLIQRQKLEADLRERIDQLQNRKAGDDSKLCIVDRYWTQLDEDMRLMLERFDETANSFAEASPGDEQSKGASSNKENSSASASSAAAGEGKKGKSSTRQLLSKLNDWDRCELDDSLKERVKFTTQTLAKLITNYEKLVKRNEHYYKELAQLTPNQDQSGKLKELHDENVRLNDTITKCELKFHTHGLEKKQLEDKISQLENELKEMSKRSGETEYELDRIRDKAFKLDRQLADTIIKLNNAQKAINNNHSGSNNSNNHCDQNGHIILHNSFNSTSNNNSTQNSNSGSAKAVNEKAVNLTDKQLSDMEFELEQQRELANNRLHELEKLNIEYQGATKQIEKLKAEIKTIPETVIEQSSEYRVLQTKYSYIVNDNIRLKQALDETRQMLEMTRANFQRQLEQMEADELQQQKRLGGEMMQLEEQLSQVRKENDLLRIEYEQNVAANEQTGPINKEMRSLISTLQTNNKLLKSDNVRCKKRVEESQIELDKAKKHSAQLQVQLQQLQQHVAAHSVKKEPSNESADSLIAENGINDSSIPSIKKEEDETTSSTTTNTAPSSSPCPATPTSNNTSNNTNKECMIREMRDLKDKNKRMYELLKEMKSIIDGYSSKSTSSSSSSSSSSEEAKRLRDLFERLKSVSKSVSSSSSTNSIISSPLSSSSSTSNQHHHADEASTPSQLAPLPPPPPPPAHSSSSSATTNAANVDYIKKIRSLEENIKELHKSLSNKKQEEAALLNDMEITGQAFEDMQEQNIRLMQQLREKDDANFKLVSERIKLENVQKILKEEKDACLAQVTTLQEQHESHLMVSKKLEEQIQQLSQKIILLEKELGQLHQACDNYKRHAIDNVQLIQELKLSSQKYLCQLKEAQSQIGEKSELVAAQTFTNKRTQEEIKHLQAKLERQKRYEMASNMDEVLREEIKEYKEQLRCPSCKIKQKDAVLTKCFHVFCYDCLQKRYDTRQRKCPKCNAGFGANDFRKLYLS